MDYTPVRRKLDARWPARGPELFRNHCEVGLNFAWNYQQSSNALFTDESRFAMRTLDGRGRKWRRQKKMRAV